MLIEEFEFERRYKELDKIPDMVGITDKIAKTPEGKQLVIGTFCLHNRDSIEEFKRRNIVKFYRPSMIDLSVGTVSVGEVKVNGHTVVEKRESPVVIGKYSRDQRAIIAYYNIKNNDGTWTTRVGISLNRSGDVFENRMGHDIAMFNILSGNYLEFKSSDHKFNTFLVGLIANLESAANEGHMNAPQKLLKIIKSWESHRSYLVK